MESRIGKLKIFLGMCPGVGKTYSMLEYGHTLQRSGRNVMIGFLETHQRLATESISEGLRRIPRKTLVYRGLKIEEMDLDQIIVESPEVCLVDELPHTNIEGMRHKKRYQDIEELLAHGIDVVTTVNIQHFDSVSDQVTAISGVRVSETVPLAFFMRADSIEVVDIAEEELMLRLKQGKVYLGERGEHALDHFFKVQTLNRLRELTFKLATQKLKNSSQHLNPSDAHLLVAISHSPHSRSLIQQSRHMAEQQSARFSAVYVQSSQLLSSSDQAQLKANVQLVENLGGRVHIIESDSIARSIAEYGQSIGATQLILGRMTLKSNFLKNFKSSLIQEIMILAPNLPLTILAQDSWATSKNSPRAFNTRKYFGASWLDWYSFCFISGITLIGLIVESVIGYRAVGFLFLMAVMLIGVYGTLTATLLSAVMSSLLWNLIFIPPRFTFIIHSHEDILMVLCYFVAASATGVLAYRLRSRERDITLKEQKTRFLNSIFSMTGQSTLTSLWPSLEKLLSEYFEGHIQIYNPLNIQEELKTQAEESSTLLWSFDHAQSAGWSTETLSQSRSLFIPLKNLHEVFGVLRFRPHRRKKVLAPDKNELLSVLISHFTAMLEKEKLEKLEVDRLQQIEVSKIQSTLLNSVSHELRTPLAEIRGLSEVLMQKNETHPTYRQLIESTQRIQNVVDNLINMNRLSSQQTQLLKEWYLVDDLVLEIQQTIPNSSTGWFLDIPSDALVYCDSHLIRLALYNLIQNAERFAKPNTKVQIVFEHGLHRAVLKVINEGPLLTDHDREHLFEPFYRGQGQSSKGLGIGLAIVKQVVELHQGNLAVNNLRSPDRVEFTITLPQPQYPELPHE